jgi:hypothetical protein
VVKIELTTEEFRKLIELAYLGEWMINAQHDPEFEDESAGALVQKLMGAHKLPNIDVDDETGEYFMKSDCWNCAPLRKNTGPSSRNTGSTVSTSSKIFEKNLQKFSPNISIMLCWSHEML